MLRYFITRYAMTEIGAKNLKKSIFSHTILNITKLFPPIIAFTFLFQYLGRLEGTEDSLSLSSITYIVIIIGMLLLMYFVARWDYVRLYNNVYEETASSRIEIANRMKKLPLSYFGKRDLTDLATTMMGDITLYEEIFSHAVPHIYSTIISTTILSLMILNYNWKLGIAALWVIPVAILIFSLSKKKQRKTIDKWIKSSRLVFDDLQENIEQIEEIKSYNLEEKSIHHFFEKLNDATKIKLETEFVSGISIAFSGILLKLGIVTVAIVGANMMIVGEINILVYIVFLIITSSIYLPIENILGFMALITLLDGVIARMKEIKTMPIQEGKTEMKLKNYDIEFKDVYFTYDEYSVINGVSFTAKQGEVTALIGPSGSGKTTLTKLAARFWDINKGQILLGGEDISKVDPETLLKNFSIVFQDVVLFNASIKDNIGIGKKGASEEEIRKAAHIARCDEFIEKMPEGINTIIGENGERLSGGERQRLSIARAILKDAPIILMDEATASLDVENESLIQEALSELIKNKTVIVIAHRMRTIRNADKIVLLHQGKIEALGTDEDLRKNSKLYQDMIAKSMS
ncbi:ABC transporter ATP-binding protein [Fusobacterium necrophorum subsp. funduliforme]|uniref:ABC transporter, ATP-binding protein n=6 Tax=Fusobacterium necrophorum TaxID=859 RepID=A0AAN3VWH1_9FUSO|nr:ABC transporter ATP-binding protein [Fusobacterium necrophorum]AYV95178.1 ABC transporter ATP-binding protein [Fusobacterium necrophorum subsp. funduliforme]AYZ72781.1 ABC transporter ATP-binding protein [Fusobacterium necrophorum]AZW09221.1 ABC transporter ATP-binding protein [Fusobacterium necrophorum subsp. necrophorum]EFS23350.1 ABC transporter, ATP-binding protein [Fusobacterium necrophorum D12]EJU18385.1 ABC transporter, ATP-binding protein [Fusobacterium necrophorum subsp. fundulifor